MSTQHYICRNCQALVLENQLCKCQVTAPIVVTEQDIDDLFKDIEEDKKEFGWDDWCPAEERDKLLKNCIKILIDTGATWDNAKNGIDRIIKSVLVA